MTKRSGPAAERDSHALTLLTHSRILTTLEKEAWRGVFPFLTPEQRQQLIAVLEASDPAVTQSISPRP